MYMSFYKPDYAESLDMYMKEISSIPFLSDEEEKQLGEKLVSGSEMARNALIKSYLRYVVAIARKHSNCGVSVEDLIGEGNLGLLFAAEEYDYRKARFSTYASYWIKRAIFDAIRDQSGITHNEDKKDNIDIYKETLSKRKNSRVLSLDQPVGDEEGSTIADFLPDERQNTEDSVLAADVEDCIIDIVSSLPKAEGDILSLYYGLKGNKRMTVGEISEAFGISEGRVNRVIRNTIRNLRTNEKVKELSCFLSE